MPFTFAFRDDDQTFEERVLQQGLDAHSASSSMPTDRDIGQYCYDGDKLIGGVTAQLVGDRLIIRLLWIGEQYRGRGLARQLLSLLEKEAAKNKCNSMLVNTYSFQAPKFYEKCGYREVARVQDYYAGQDRIFYRKEL